MGPIKETQIAGMNYHSGNYKKYISKNLLKRKMIEKFNLKLVSVIKEILDNLELRNRDAVILDAGCGEGFIDHVLFKNFSGIEIKGLEYTEEALCIAKKMNPQAEYIQGDICNMIYEDDSVDIAVCTEVLEHLRDPDKAVYELLRVARKYVVITVPEEPWFCMGNIMSFKNIHRLGNPIDHINHWTYREFREFIGSHFKGKADFGRSFPWSIAVLSLERKYGEDI